MKRKARILIVDDDEDICKTLSLILREEGYETDIANTGREAIKKSRENFYNVALLDIKLPDVEGTELLTKMRETSPKMIKIMVTGYPALKNAVEALNRGADAYLMKPVNPEKVIKTIKEKLKKQREEEVMTEEKIAMFVKTRTQKLLQESK
ncbi:response regulator [Candidatus Bathyarchaeota archaeon]|nr:response regulator [Candidatus Bathyarchaeota archaeon]